MEHPEITGPTLDHYNRAAAGFWEGTRGHDVSQNIAALLKHLRESPAPMGVGVGVGGGVGGGAGGFTILDFGCGPGRDLKAFTDLGHVAVGLEGAERLAAMAREHSGCEVWLQDFLNLDLPGGRFDGVFANASLFHVPRAELPRVLRELHATLKPDGVLFSSNPRGQNEEGWNRGRYGAYHDLEAWRRYLDQAGFEELEHYYRPAGMPREQQPWLASVSRKRVKST